MEMKLELVPVPVTDVDRAKAFYTDQVGFNADLDERFGEQFRVVQLTPPGSACSICIGVGIVDTPPGSIENLHLVVPDIHAARAELLGRGVEISEVQDMTARASRLCPTPTSRTLRATAGHSSNSHIDRDA